MLEDAGHVGDVDAAGNDLTAVGKVEPGEPSIKCTADGQRSGGVIAVGPKAAELGRQLGPFPARAEAKGKPRPKVTITQVKLLASVHDDYQRVAVTGG